MQRHISLNGIEKLLAGVSHVEIQLAIGAEDESVHPMIVVLAANAGEKQLPLISFAVTVGVGQDENVGRARNNHLVP